MKSTDFAIPRLHKGMIRTHVLSVGPCPQLVKSKVLQGVSGRKDDGFGPVPLSPCGPPSYYQPEIGGAVRLTNAPDLYVSDMLAISCSKNAEQMITPTGVLGAHERQQTVAGVRLISAFQVLCHLRILHPFQIVIGDVRLLERTKKD